VFVILQLLTELAAFIKKVFQKPVHTIPSGQSDELHDQVVKDALCFWNPSRETLLYFDSIHDVKTLLQRRKY
jgi:hypothetical protein